MIDRIGSIGSLGGIGAAGGIGGLGPMPPLRPQQDTRVQQNDFAAYLAQAARETAQELKAAEATAIRGIEGKADIQEVVDQVMAAERTLSAALAIRNKLVAAWMEISRMQI